MGVQGGHHLSEIGKINLHNDEKEILFGKGVFVSFPTLCSMNRPILSSSNEETLSWHSSGWPDSVSQWFLPSFFLSFFSTCSVTSPCYSCTWAQMSIELAMVNMAFLQDSKTPKRPRYLQLRSMSQKVKDMLKSLQTIILCRLNTFIIL